jgi:hypothetical protein
MRATGIALVLVVAACQADRPNVGKPDAMPMMMMLDKPAIDPGEPTSTPNTTVAVRGTTDGSRIVVKGGPGDPVVMSALPTGGFCVDSPLMSGANALTVYALKDGLISPPAMLTVTQDAAAPIPANAVCGGMEQPMCVPEDGNHGDCADGKDNDCNGLTDSCDPGCNGCVDDALAPNNTPFFVPMVAAGTYNLELCPCAPDYFAFTVAPGGVVHAVATFDSATIDIDMMLQVPADAESMSTTNVAVSETTTSTEMIDYTSTAGGTYYLKVYPYDSSKFGAYTLTIY